MYAPARSICLYVIHVCGCGDVKPNGEYMESLVFALLFNLCLGSNALSRTWSPSPSVVETSPSRVQRIGCRKWMTMMLSICKTTRYVLFCLPQPLPRWLPQDDFEYESGGSDQDDGEPDLENNYYLAKGTIIIHSHYWSWLWQTLTRVVRWSSRDEIRKPTGSS